MFHTMVINYFGGGSFRLQSGDTSLLVDPDNNRLKADVVLRTLASATLPVAGEVAPGNEISFPGEYEMKGIEILGVPLLEESGEKFLKTAYLVTWEEIKLAFFGHLSKTPSAETIEKLNEPDVVFLPVGGGHFLEASAAAKLVKQLEPALVVPAFYKTPADFLKAMGQKVSEQEKLVFKKKDLASEEMKVVLLGSRG